MTSVAALSGIAASGTKVSMVLGFKIKRKICILLDRWSFLVGCKKATVEYLPLCKLAVRKCNGAFYCLTKIVIK